MDFGGLDPAMSDFGARYYDPYTVRWTTRDPLASKYPSLSPYNYCAGNLVDPEGMEVNILGPLANNALSQLQDKFKDQLSLSIDENGSLSYSVNEGVKLRGQAKLLARIINDRVITVNLMTTDADKTSTGNLLVGGAFMGNSISEGKITANQEINPLVLGAADSFTQTPGKMIMHELTESYYGGIISGRKGMNAPMATRDVTNDPASTYMRAHNRATPQSTVYHEMYDKNGNKTESTRDAVRVEWYVTKGGKRKIIQTLK